MQKVIIILPLLLYELTKAKKVDRSDKLIKIRDYWLLHHSDDPAQNYFLSNMETNKNYYYADNMWREKGIFFCSEQF